MTQRRNRNEREMSFEDCLAEEARRFAAAAEKEIPGSTARELLLRRARQAETASRANKWSRSPGLKAPS
jgi:hypothetical protein